VLGVGAALLCLIGILWIVRGRRGPSPFVRGGRNRNPRLQVLDAAAVDTRRRLVLVRRDDVEHLIMIGGPSDIVIESRISPTSKTVDTRPEDMHQPVTASTPAPIAAPPKPIAAPAARPAPPSPVQEAALAPPLRQEPRQEQPREQPVREMRTAPAPTATSAPAPTAASAPIAAARIEPAVADVVAPMQAQPANTTSAAIVVPIQRAPESAAGPPTPALDDAAKLLDSARDRVFSERPNQSPAQPMAPTPAIRPAAPVGEHTTALGSDFEKILEEEMASSLAARDAALAGRGTRPVPQVAANIPTAGPAVPVPGAPRQDPSLQTEVARIFGEMSASRDK
jgi:hypothetical protein